MNLKTLCNLFAATVALLGASSSYAGAVLDRVKASGTVRVCIWPDYYGITYRSPRNQQLVGLDIDLSREFAKDLGVSVIHVDCSFASLMQDLDDERLCVCNRQRRKAQQREMPGVVAPCGSTIKKWWSTRPDHQQRCVDECLDEFIDSVERVIVSPMNVFEKNDRRCITGQVPEVADEV